MLDAFTHCNSKRKYPAGYVQACWQACLLHQWWRHLYSCQSSHYWPSPKSISLRREHFDKQAAQNYPMRPTPARKRGSSHYTAGHLICKGKFESHKQVVYQSPKWWEHNCFWREAGWTPWPQVCIQTRVPDRSLELRRCSVSSTCRCRATPGAVLRHCTWQWIIWQFPCTRSSHVHQDYWLHDQWPACGWQHDSAWTGVVAFPSLCSSWFSLR